MTQQTDLKKAPAYIYIAHIIDDYYKIGWSTNPKMRIYKFGLSVKDIVHTIGTDEPLWAETIIHTVLESNRVPLCNLSADVLKKMRATSHEVYRLNDKELSELKTLHQLYRPM